VGVQDVNASAERVWPNPATDHVMIEMQATSGNVVVELLDVTGRLVLDRTADAQARKDGLLRLNVNGLARGEYVLRIRHAEGSSAHRIVLH
jgi:hypothetical protein